MSNIKCLNIEVWQIKRSSLKILYGAMSSRWLFHCGLVNMRALGWVLCVMMSLTECVFLGDAEQELMPFKSVVVSTGGGAVIRKQNWGYMQHGVVVWLTGPPELLSRRAVRDGTQSRPLLSQSSAGAEEVGGILSISLDSFLFPFIPTWSLPHVVVLDFRSWSPLF